MQHIKIRLPIVLTLATPLLLSGCFAMTPKKAEPKAAPPAQPQQASLAQPKSLQEVADEAMHSKGKLTREQIDALIRANAKCSAKDPRYSS